jgi:hypothetical protein
VELCSVRWELCSIMMGPVWAELCSKCMALWALAGLCPKEGPVWGKGWFGLGLIYIVTSFLFVLRLAPRVRSAYYSSLRSRVNCYRSALAISLRSMLEHMLYSAALRIFTTFIFAHSLRSLYRHFVPHSALRAALRYAHCSSLRSYYNAHYVRSIAPVPGAEKRSMKLRFN